MTVKNNFIRIIVVLLLFVSCKDNEPVGEWKEYYIHEKVLKQPTVLEYDVSANGMEMKKVGQRQALVCILLKYR